MKYSCVIFALLNISFVVAADIWNDERIAQKLETVSKRYPIQLKQDRMRTEKLRVCRQERFDMHTLSAYAQTHIAEQFCPLPDELIEAYVYGLADAIPPNTDLFCRQKWSHIKQNICPKKEISTVHRYEDYFKTLFFKDAPWFLQRYLISLCVEHNILHPNAPLPHTGLCALDHAFIHKDTEVILFLASKGGKAHTPMILHELERIALWLVSDDKPESAHILHMLSLDSFWPRTYQPKKSDATSLARRQKSFSEFEETLRKLLIRLYATCSRQKPRTVRQKIRCILFDLHNRFPCLSDDLAQGKLSFAGGTTPGEKTFMACMEECFIAHGSTSSPCWK